ncbi:hypothetical protein [Sinobacterium caligoides]|uniref:hypothetical protein n=1 Tax=Sinobacterium caligoides TaxID=933926 RepID=UPI000F4BF9C7|nr:hypothetical protein [Sinobacterium caligoides]
MIFIVSALGSSVFIAAVLLSPLNGGILGVPIDGDIDTLQAVILLEWFIKRASASSPVCGGAEARVK